MAQASAAVPVSKLDAQAQGQMAAAKSIIDQLRIQEEAAAAQYEEEKRLLDDRHDQHMTKLQAQYEAQVAQIEATYQLASAQQAAAAAQAASASAAQQAANQQAAAQATALAQFAQQQGTATQSMTAFIHQFATAQGLSYAQAETAVNAAVKSGAVGTTTDAGGNASYIFGDRIQYTAPVGSALAKAYEKMWWDTSALNQNIQQSTGSYLYGGIESQIGDYKAFIDGLDWLNNKTYTQNGLLDFMASRGINMGQFSGAGIYAQNLRDLLPKFGITASYAVGTPYVPEDGPAYLHKGEMVVPAAYNPNNVGYRQTDNNSAVVVELRILNERMARVEAATTATAGFTAGTDRQLRRVIKSDAITTETV